eukprot:m.194215 g.194215  ORF g.194215 m.194215 type:complete len:332 (+) comp18645_c0_seq22:84-1079(+)
MPCRIQLHKYKEVIKRSIVNNYNAIFHRYIQKQYSTAPPSGSQWEDVRDEIRFIFWRDHKTKGQQAFKLFQEQSEKNMNTPDFTYDNFKRVVDADVDYCYLSWERLGPANSKTPVSQLLPDMTLECEGAAKSRREMRGPQKTKSTGKRKKRKTSRTAKTDADEARAVSMKFPTQDLLGLKRVEETLLSVVHAMDSSRTRPTSTGATLNELKTAFDMASSLGLTQDAKRYYVEYKEALEAKKTTTTITGEAIGATSNTTRSKTAEVRAEECQELATSDDEADIEGIAEDEPAEDEPGVLSQPCPCLVLLGHHKVIDQFEVQCFPCFHILLRV